MYKTLMTVVVVAAVAATSTTAQAASRSCGKTNFLDGGGSARVTIVRGRLSCTQARGIVRLYRSKRGTAHDFSGHQPLDYGTYPGGWRCSSLEQGNAACFRGPFRSMKHGMTAASVRHARDEVALLII
jgi:hypothetical protein